MMVPTRWVDGPAAAELQLHLNFMEISFVQRNAARSLDSDQTGALSSAGQTELKILFLHFLFLTSNVFRKNNFTAAFSRKMRLFKKSGCRFANSTVNTKHCSTRSASGRWTLCAWWQRSCAAHVNFFYTPESTKYVGKTCNWILKISKHKKTSTCGITAYGDTHIIERIIIESVTDRLCSCIRLKK